MKKNFTNFWVLLNKVLNNCNTVYSYNYRLYTIHLYSVDNKIEKIFAKIMRIVYEILLKVWEKLK